MVSGNSLNVDSAPPQDYADKDAERERTVNEFTPSRTATWWYSAIHNITAMVGAGVLSLPYTMVFLGWGPGIVVHVLSWLVTLYTLWQLVQMHEIVPGKRFDRYHELAQHAFGEKIGLWILVPPNLTVEVGVNIVYMVTGGQSLKKFHETVCRSCKPLRKTYWILIFSSIHYFLALLPNLNSVAGVSMAAALMSLCYSTIAWVACVYRGRVEDVSYDYLHTTPATTVFRVFNSLGVIGFAYAGHNVALEIQATIPSSPERPSKIPMWRGVLLAYFVVALCYFPVAITGYWAFGQIVSDNLLLTLRKPDWLIAAANMMVGIHVVGSYQVFAMPVYDGLERVLVKKFKLPPGRCLRLVARFSYIAFTTFIAVTFPFFGDLLGFFGGLAFTPTSYFLPSMMWLAICKPKRYSLSWLVNWFCIWFGFTIMVVSTIGGFRSLLTDASTYRFYQ
jgi:amino acid permease